MAADSPRSDRFDQTILIRADADRVIAAFFDPAALSAWWLTIRSVTTPRPLGVYAVEWAPTADADPVLGRLGGVFYGLMMEFRRGQEFFVADAWWIPPDGDPVGPMALQVDCMQEGGACRLRVRQSGFEDTPRFRRYYSVIARGWHISLAALKAHLEKPGPP